MGDCWFVFVLQKGYLGYILLKRMLKITKKLKFNFGVSIHKLKFKEMKKAYIAYIIFLLILLACLALDSASAQLLTPKVDSLSAGKQATNKDTLPFTQVKTRHLFGVELAGAGGLASLNYSYFRNHVMYQIGLGVIPAMDFIKADDSWLIPIQIQLQNPKYCECALVNFDIGFWGRIDITNNHSFVDEQFHAVGLSLKLKNYLKNNEDWIVQFGIYPYYDFNQRKIMTTFGLQFSK